MCESHARVNNNNNKRERINSNQDGSSLKLAVYNYQVKSPQATKTTTTTTRGNFFKRSRVRKSINSNMYERSSLLPLLYIFLIVIPLLPSLHQNESPVAQATLINQDFSTQSVNQTRSSNAQNDLVIQQQQQNNKLAPTFHSRLPTLRSQSSSSSSVIIPPLGSGNYVKLGGNSSRIIQANPSAAISASHLSRTSHLNYHKFITTSNLTGTNHYLYNQLQPHQHYQLSTINLPNTNLLPKLHNSLQNAALEQQQQQNHQQQQQQKRAGLLEKICIGTSNRMSGQHNKSDHYQNLAERYRNCTYVIGNLEITWLDNSETRDLSFLESIREITGYLLIAYVEVEKIRMPNLQIIRGRDLFKVSSDQKEEFALILIENELKQLELPNLREILAGSVGSYNNRNLCHIRTINWDEILNWPMYGSVFVYNGTEPECPSCDGSCQGSCWGEGQEMCQKFSKNNCSPQCSQQNRCFGPSSAECCHSFCAGGCTGPKQTDCLACKNFYDDGECIQECPSMQRYNPSKFLWESNPNGKYAFGGTCVKECPEHLLRDNGACVRTCPLNKRNINGECVICPDPCPKNCQGVEVVHSGNIDQLINCTVIEGSISIQDSSFRGSEAGGSSATSANSTTSFGGYKPMHPNRLEVFKTLREITGYLNIQANHTDFKNLSYFRNLKFIGGREKVDMFYALSITKTSLVSLNLRSLRKVKSGKIFIEDNPDLCFADLIDWSQTNITKREDITTRNNADQSRCRQLNLQCHEECHQDGCWGPGADECLSCKTYMLEDRCVKNCTSLEPVLSFDAGSNTCKKCHPECKLGCQGVEARHCWQCKNVKDGPYCVAECPSHKFNNNGTCEECDRSCVDGCSGPSNKLGEGGCNSCGKAIINYSTEVPPGTPIQVSHCIRADETCPEGYYQEYVGPQPEGPLRSSSGKPVCRKCHHRCKSCTGMGSHVSVCECNKYVAGEQCEDYCPRDYFADEQLRQCVKCSPECNGCFGPTEADCISCRVYRIYYESNSYTPSSSSSSSSGNLISNSNTNQPAISSRLTASIVSAAATIMDSAKYSTASENGNSLVSKQVKFNCTAQCPSDKPHRISESNMLDPYCSEDPGLDGENPRIVSLGSTSLLFMLIISAAIMICISIHRCQIEKDKTMELTKHLSGIDDVEPLKPSNMKPNLAPLRSIKETELRRGSKLGEGFGGTVFQGYWYPEGQDRKERRPVAIKVLRDNGQSNMNKEFLDEAYIMASVNHPNLVRLLAVCMTPSHLMLVTQLIPLGCLLEYVKKHKKKIGSKNLLEWGKQIARGMSYLEERRMVHRDLALRNVLLQKTGRALISDFGLAKFLEIDQSEYQSGGGKLPIKWLAPECIRERKFTHKSDVWAFGVTVWELLTFGQRPFEEYETRDVPIAIENGARLEQPGYVSAEVYKVMYACWFYNPDDRPNFRSLTQNFVNFARDPERYLICGTKGIEYNNLSSSNCLSTPNSKHTTKSLTDRVDGRRVILAAGDSDDFNSSSSSEDGNNSLSSSEVDDDDDDDEEPPLTAMSTLPDLTPTTNNRMNEMFGFEMRHATSGHHHHQHHQQQQQQHPTHLSPESEQANNCQQQQLSPTIKSHMSLFHQQSLGDEEVFVKPSQQHQQHQQRQQRLQSQSAKGSGNLLTSTDANNNNNFVQNNNNTCWPMHHAMSTNSLGRKSEQPTDMYDYLLPSPCTDEQSQFSTFYTCAYDPKSTPVTPNMRNPPNSAGLIGVNNEEYFLTRLRENYVNQQSTTINGQQQQQQQQLESNQQMGCDVVDATNQQHQLMNTSNGNIPHSLV